MPSVQSLWINTDLHKKLYLLILTYAHTKGRFQKSTYLCYANVKQRLPYLVRSKNYLDFYLCPLPKLFLLIRITEQHNQKNTEMLGFNYALPSKHNTLICTPKPNREE